MKAKNLLLIVIGLCNTLSCLSQTFSVDAGLQWQAYWFNPPYNNLKQSTGIGMGASKRLFSDFEGRIGTGLFFFETFEDKNEKFYWSSPGKVNLNNPSGVSLSQWQVDLQLRWRPQGFDNGFFLGLGAGWFKDFYDNSIQYDRTGSPYLIPYQENIQFVSLHSGYDLKVNPSGSIQFNGSVLFAPQDKFINAHFFLGAGLGWRWVNAS